MNPFEEFRQNVTRRHFLSAGSHLLGTAALASRGFGDEQFTEVADIIGTALAGASDVETLKARVSKLAADFPLYEGLEDWRLI